MGWIKNGKAFYSSNTNFFELFRFDNDPQELKVFMLLSREVLDDVLKANTGSYALATFLSAFSERYFLKLLNAEPISEENKTKMDSTLVSRSLSKNG